MKQNVRTHLLNSEQLIPATFDYVFTGIFNNSENIEIIEEFLACILDLELELLKGNIQILPRHLPIQNKKQKNAQMDLLIHYHGNKLNIELNNCKAKGILERNIVYACNIHSRNLKYQDNSYTNIGKTIQIQINNFRSNLKNIKETCYIKKENGELLSEKFKIIMVDLELGSKTCYNEKEEKLAGWAQILRATSKQELKKILGGNIMSKKAGEKYLEEVEKYSRDEDVVALYMNLPKEELERNTLIEEASQNAHREGKEVGLREGQEQEKINIARNLKVDGIDFSIISRSTGLTLQQIKNL